MRPLSAWRMVAACTLVALGLAVGPSLRSAGAQPTPRVPLDDPAYQDVERLVSAGLVRTVIYGQRPWTERDVRRMALEAQGRVTPSAVGDVRAALDRLLARFGGDEAARNAWHVGWRQEVLGLDAPAIRLTNAPVGDVRASVTPLLTGQGGRPFADGASVAAEPVVSRAFGRHVLLHLRPRAAITGRADARTATLALQEGSLAVSAFNLVAEVGRQQIMWGPGLDGGVLLSGSGRPLDAVRVRTDAPWRAPSLLRWLGLLRGELLFADLGAGQNFPNAKVGAYRLSGQVTSYFELAAAVLVHTGGRGAPSVPFRERVLDFIPALKYALPDDDTQFSNKFAGWDWRVRIPQWHGFQLYSESVFDDMDPRRWRSTLWEDGGHVLGVSVAPLGGWRGAGIAPTLEFRHTGLRFYRHTIFSSGLTFNHTLLGDPLGPQGDAATLRLTRLSPGGQRVVLDLAVERRGQDRWATTADNANNDGFRFVLTEARPADWRERLRLDADLGTVRGGRFTMLSGVERVRATPTMPARMNLLLGARWTGLVDTR